MINIARVTKDLDMMGVRFQDIGRSKRAPSESVILFLFLLDSLISYEMQVWAVSYDPSSFTDEVSLTK